MADDVATIVRELTKAVKARRVAITPDIKRQIRDCAADMAAVSVLRDMLNAGEEIDFDAYMKLRQACDASRRQLLGESALPAVTGLAVSFEPSRHEMLPIIDALRAEVAALKARLGETVQNPPLGAGEPAGAVLPPTGGSEPLPSDSQPARPLAPSDGHFPGRPDCECQVCRPHLSGAATASSGAEPVRQPGEDSEAYLARRKHWAGDRPMRPTLPFDGMGFGATYREGLPCGVSHRRFDNPWADRS